MRFLKSLIRLKANSAEPDLSTRMGCLLRWADQLVEQQNNEGLRDLMKIVLRPVQALHLSDAYLKPEHKATTELWWLDSMGWGGYVPALGMSVDKYILAECLRAGSDSDSIDLASDMIFPTVWHPTSLVRTLGQIGDGRPCGAFKQSLNHKVTSMPLLTIAWVSGGNHSISQAVIRGEGVIVPREVIDISSLIPHIRFDGRKWRCIENDAPLGEPRYEAFGWVWELARRVESLKSTNANTL